MTWVVWTEDWWWIPPRQRGCHCHVSLRVTISPPTCRCVIHNPQIHILRLRRVFVSGLMMGCPPAPLASLASKSLHVSASRLMMDFGKNHNNKIPLTRKPFGWLMVQEQDSEFYLFVYSIPEILLNLLSLILPEEANLCLLKSLFREQLQHNWQYKKHTHVNKHEYYMKCGITELSLLSLSWWAISPHSP